MDPLSAIIKKEKTEEYKMQDEKNDTSKVFLAGQIFGQLVLDHITGERRFYGGKVYVNIDGKECFVPIMATEEVFKKCNLSPSLLGNKWVKIEGFLNSFKPQNGQTKIFVYVSRISIARSEEERFYQNAVYLSGKVKSKPISWKNKSKNREKAEFWMEVQRYNTMVDQIPVYCKGKTAKKATHFFINKEVSLKGQLNTRCGTSCEPSCEVWAKELE